MTPADILRKIRWRVIRWCGYIHLRVKYSLSGATISDEEFDRVLNEGIELRGLGTEIGRGGSVPIFFVGLQNKKESIDFLRLIYSEAEALIVNAADQTCAHVFDLLGSGPVFLGEQIDWHLDFKTGFRFDSRKFYAAIRPAAYPGGYDIKVPWELSRCQHFSSLGQAYWITGDEKYAREFVEQVTDWVDKNPPMQGVNWTCTMDVAIRVVNWLWGIQFFANSAHISDSFLRKFYKSLLIHGRHIMNNLEWSESLTTNHYLSDIVGLVYLGILVPEFKEAEQWREFGLGELEKEMFRQVYPDGVDFEASTSYHRLVTELFLSAVILARINGHEFSREFMKRLEKMVEFLMFATKPDGTMPLIGDADNGRLHRLKVWDPPEREWVDFRYLLGIGAILFEREDFSAAAGDQWEEAVWVIGPEAVRKWMCCNKPDHQAQVPSRAFPDAGLYVMRGEDAYLMINAGPVGQNGSGGHSHNDLLSFELFANGQTWIIDPGMPVYTADYELRNRYRTTAYHNTVVVDGQEQNFLDPRQSFWMGDCATIKIIDLSCTDDEQWFTAAISGFLQNEKDCVHQRQIILNRTSGSISITDKLINSEREHLMKSYLHLPEGMQIEYDNYRVIDIRKQKLNVSLRITWAGDKMSSVEIGSMEFYSGYGFMQQGQYIGLSSSTGEMSINLQLI